MIASAAQKNIIFDSAQEKQQTKFQQKKNIRAPRTGEQKKLVWIQLTNCEVVSVMSGAES